MNKSEIKNKPKPNNKKTTKNIKLQKMQSNNANYNSIYSIQIILN